MHTPDGLITGWICVLLLIVSAVPIALALRNLSRSVTRRKALMIGTVAAVIFMAQMLNFPIAEGTSGHLIGASLALILLGLDGAVLAMSIVLIVQTLVFGDGGMLAMGANLFNMAIVGVYAADFACKKLPLEGNVRAFSIAALSVVAASTACALELAASGTFPLWPVLGAMTVTHIVIGIGEGLLTMALAGLFLSRLESLSLRTALGLSGVSFLALALALPFASGSPDGLESVAIELGFFDKAVGIYPAPLQDYSLAVLDGVPYLAALSAALIGSAMVFSIPQLLERIPVRTAA